MGSNRVDYSELVHALQENEQGQANELLEELLPRLVDYLEVTMNADKNEAEDCVHAAYVRVHEKILKDKIRNKKYIFSYLLQACRNEYIHYTNKQHRFVSQEDDEPNYLTKPAEQIENLMDEDRQRILSECLEELREWSRMFIEYIFDRPETTTKQLSKRFEISGANVRTRKSRILSRLHHCFKRKWRQ